MTDSEAKEWVTIKIPEGVRDDARDDPRTYGEIMRDGLLDGDVSGASEAEKQLAEAWDTAARGGIPDDDLREQLDRIESAAATAEERTGSIENTLESMGGR